MSTTLSAPWRTLGISRSWYFYVTKGHRTPSPRLALRWYDLTGERYGILAGLDGQAIDALRVNLETA